jgi:hypothetical protein
VDNNVYTLLLSYAEHFECRRGPVEKRKGEEFVVSFMLGIIFLLSLCLHVTWLK